MSWRIAVSRALRKISRDIKDDSGQAMVLMALGFVVLCGMAALSIDIGHAYMDKQRVKATADSIAISVANEVSTQTPSPSDGQYTTSSTAPTSGITWQTVAYQTAMANDKAAVYTVMIDTENKVVTVSGHETGSTWLARVVGVDWFGVQVVSKAEYGPTTSANNLVPIGLPYSSLTDSSTVAVGKTMQLTYAPGNTSNPGDYAYVYFSQQGDAALKSGTMVGSPDQVSVGETINTQTGVNTGAALEAATCRIEAATNQPLDTQCTYGSPPQTPTWTESDPRLITVPIINTSPSGTGSYPVLVVGFASIEIDSVTNTGSNKYITGTIVSTDIPGKLGNQGGADTSSYPPLPINSQTTMLIE